MANIKIAAPCPLYDGMPVLFKAPCGCTAVEGLAVSYGGKEYLFKFKDAHGNILTGIGNLFSEGAFVKALLDTVNGFAYLQNADTNAYLENALKEKFSPSNKPSVSDIKDFPKAMPASDVYEWAKSQTKPKYTANEVGAAPSGYGLGTTGTTKSWADVDSIKANGWYAFSDASVDGFSGAAIMRVDDWDVNFCSQTVYLFLSKLPVSYSRICIGGKWSAWAKESKSVYAGARGSAASLSLPSGTITQLTLDTWTTKGHSAFEFKNGGVRVPFDGVVRISGSVYMKGSTSNPTMGVYIKKSPNSYTDFSNSTEVGGTLIHHTVEGSVGITPMTVEVGAGDVIYLCARARNAASECLPSHETATHLDIVYL